MESKLNTMIGILETKNKYNSDPKGSNVLIDPCEINLELVRKDCENWTGNGCLLGTLMKEGEQYCPLQPQRKLTLRSSFASTEAAETLA